MTALLAFRNCNNKIIYVCPYISEISNSYNDCELPVPSYILKKMVLSIKKWLGYHFNKFTNQSVLSGEGPTIDFSILEKYEYDHVDYSKINRMVKFYNFVLFELYNRQILEGNSKICCFIHSKLMKLYFKYPFNVFNTQIFREILNIDIMNRLVIRRSICYGNPPFDIRKILNRENIKKNINLCNITWN